MTQQQQKKLKLIWDFRGPDSARTAEHHAIHLKEYADNNNLSLPSGFEAIKPDHHIAYLVVNESEMRPVRDALRPHRGQVYSPE